MSYQRNTYSLRERKTHDDFLAQFMHSKKTKLSEDDYIKEGDARDDQMNADGVNHSDSSLFEEEPEFNTDTKQEVRNQDVSPQPAPNNIEMNKKMQQREELKRLLVQNNKENKDKSNNMNLKTGEIKRRRHAKKPKTSPEQPEMTPEEIAAQDTFQRNMMQLDQFRTSKAKTLDGLHSVILSWDLSTLTLDLENLPITFPDTDTYIRLFNHHILDEIRSQTLQCREKCRYQKGIYEGFSVDRTNDSFTTINVTINKVLSQEEFNNIFTEIYLEKPSKTNPQKGYMGISYVRLKSAESINLYIKMNTDIFNQIHFADQQILYLYPLLHLSTTEREYLSLHNIPNISLSSLILNPVFKEESIQTMNSVLTQDYLSYLHTSYNESQYKCISKCIENEGVILIQGPPGTGKTQTVYGILNTINISIYNTYKNKVVDTVLDYIVRREISKYTLQQLINIFKESIPKPRILVVAPSNAAVDVIITRCLTNQFYGNDTIKYMPKLLRLGKGSNPSHANITLEFIAEDRKKKTGSESESILKDINNIKKEREDTFKGIIEYIKKQLTRMSLDQFRKNKYFKKTMNDLVQCIEVYSDQLETQSQFTNDNDKFIQKSILNNCDIIFTTLSSSGVSLLDEIDQYKREFDCIIIDEACQSTELSTLIPIRFGTKKLILVGDPQQLPATVFSIEAMKKGYGRSMFKRFMDNGYPVYMLNIQYRCHPFISLFPSTFFYNSELHNSKHVQQKRYHKKYHDNPLYYPVMFYNMISGREQNVKMSYKNTSEAEFVVNLYTSFLTQYPEESSSKILILTPYKEQQHLLIEMFKNINQDQDTQSTDPQSNQLRTNLKLNTKTFPIPLISTVDAFQGQEADIVILSTVRAGDQKGIGFVNDIHRLNVSITRPKFALWIVGSSKRLKQATVWKEYCNFCYKYSLFRTVENPNVDINTELWNKFKRNPPIPQEFIPTLDDIPLDSNGNINIKEYLVEEKPGTTISNEVFVYSDGELNDELVYKPIYYPGMLKPLNTRQP